jgi:hypothetical protein
LAGRFLPEHPDDLQVLVHEGGPRLTDRHPEVVWITVTGCEGEVFTGRVLNQPTQLSTIRQGQQIRFLMPAACEHPILVTDKYLRERSGWTIHPCRTCGFSELFDAPSDLMRAAFPDLPKDAGVEAFTSFCPFCGGVQTLERKPIADPPRSAGAAKKPWWQIWK